MLKEDRELELNYLAGTRNKVYREGTHFTFPFLEWPIVYDIHARTLFLTCNAIACMRMKIGLRVLSRPVADQLPTIYRTLGKDYNNCILPSIAQETLKAVTVSQEIHNLLTDRAASFHIAANDVYIINLTFGKEFTAAIEAKHVAAEEAERAKYIVEKAEQDKKNTIIRAQGEAKNSLLVGKAIGNNRSSITLRRIEASREIAKTVSESKSRVLLNTEELILNVQVL
ncbi:Prohibitin-like protein [Handroanthus impetiginosus]|uniref:Prohibitin n=1 Tax=Handroanthus impetiginosus TaxID=429701 RepID=A0A2G9HND2_9LAMI|nr:Prohibitin-like protein [Handroanthus impetiginosus]